MTTKRWTALYTGLDHCLDHLGVLCIELGLPLIVTEAKTFAAARRFYPELDCCYVEFADIDLGYLAKNFDVIFGSDHRMAAELIPLFELLFRKKMRMVYCPHGNSDKGHSNPPLFPKDISLFYGPHMKSHLKKTGQLNQVRGLVRTGNYRWRHYLKNQSFYDGLIQAHVQKLDKERRTVFYAPSWPDGENPSSFLTCARRVIEEVGEFFNILLKWHPLLEEHHISEIEQLRHRYEEKKGVVFLNNFPTIYPILQISDIYLGDFSSIGYDFLALNRPLYFFDTYPGKLEQCGRRVPLHDHFGKFLLQQEDAKESLRTKTYHEVFGNERKGEEILKELKKALSKDRALWITD